MEGRCYILTISKIASNYLSTLSFFFILLLKTGRGELNTTKSTVFFVKWCKNPMSQLIQRGSCWLYQFVIYKRSISAWSARMNGERECRKREGSQMGIGRMCKKTIIQITLNVAQKFTSFVFNVSTIQSSTLLSLAWEIWSLEFGSFVGWIC